MRSRKNINKKKSASQHHRSLPSRTGQTTLQIQKQLQKKPEVEWTIDRLTASYVPQQIVGRQAQKLVIDSFVQNCLLNRVGCKVLYISGIPGVGKTASTLQILKKLEAQSKNKVKLGFINALTLKQPEKVYPFLLQIINNGQFKQVQKKHISYCKKLEAVLPKLTKPHIIVIDQIDFLLTKDQSILYNLFDWVYHATAKLGLIVIANTMDFPEKLSSKVNSRMGNNRLVFKPYTFQQIRAIVEQRLQGCKLFTPPALTFASKKLSTFSSDIRTVLDILYKAVQNNLQSQSLNKITIQQIARLWEQKISLVSITNKGQTLQKLHMQILDYIKKNDNVCNSRPLLDILLQKGMTQINFAIILKQLQEMNYISVTQQRTGMFPSFNLRLLQRYKC